VGLDEWVSLMKQRTLDDDDGEEVEVGDATELLVQVLRDEREDGVFCKWSESCPCMQEMAPTASADFVPGVAHDGLAIRVHLVAC
jgi:hypothetical protein